MKFIIYSCYFFLIVCSFSCSTSSNNGSSSATGNGGSGDETQSTKRSKNDFNEKDLYGKWRFIEDYGKDNEREKGNVVFRKDNTAVFIDKSSDIEESNYSFDEEAKILTVWRDESDEKEKLVVEVLDFNEILIKGEHESGNAFVTKLIRNK